MKKGFKPLGPGANRSKKINMMRRALAGATERHGSGGTLKEKHPPRHVTLPGAEILARLKPAESF